MVSILDKSKLELTVGNRGSAHIKKKWVIPEEEKISYKKAKI
jgi:hypothetical protein